MGRRLDLKHPERYTEKLQWLKLYDRKPEYSRMVDKIAVKEYVAERIGQQYIIPTYGVWAHFDDIDFDGLPDKFVLKTNHSGGSTGVVICRDKSALDKASARRWLERSLKDSFYRRQREWPYKQVRPMIFAEQLLEDAADDDVKDYKFYCFNGEPKVLLVASNRRTTHNFEYFDMDFRHLPNVSNSGPNAEEEPSRPECFGQMKQLAERLSEGFPHLRVDMYCINQKIYFGELTFFDSSGFDNNSDDRLDMEWGNWIRLPENKKYK